ncbi:PREDICTED: uncharacterized protein LOC105120737 isoform X11 [Populus euphratica]|uniref:Uncharacterized protein LOC105120737 isoform X11 n=1 Tax=Populus euphratica TaxID=75702 RepID=A0AAJ6TV92_POPEU|nr:PREDICTED: uncharacterized protein LOC105120737 isoform X11 [Populus euphratica]
MATNPTKKPSDHQRLEAADAKRKRKQEIDKKSREKKKNKQDNNEAQLKTLQDECNYYKGQVDLCKSMMKPLLDDTCQIGKFVQELGESRGHARDTVEKQTGMVNECWDIIKACTYSYMDAVRIVILRDACMDHNFLLFQENQEILNFGRQEHIHGSHTLNRSYRSGKHCLESNSNFFTSPLIVKSDFI